MVNTNVNFLNDNFLTTGTGTDMTELINITDELTKKTKTKLFPVKKANFLLYKEEREKSVIFREINDFIAMEDIATMNCIVDEVELEKENFSEAFFKAAKKTAVMKINNEYFILSEKALFSLKDKFKADAIFMTEYSLPTLLTLREAANNNSASVKVVYREVGDIKKIFYVGCEKFNELLNDSFMVEMLDKLPIEMAREMDLINYVISQEKTIIYSCFPEIEEEIKEKYQNFNLEPVLIAQNSLIGESSLIFQEGWKTPKGMILRGNGVSFKHLFQEKRNHTFENLEDEIIEKVKEKIFVDYFELPKRFEALSEIEITSEEMSNDEMRVTYENIVSEVIRKCFKTELSRKKKALIKERLRNHFTASMPITALMVTSWFFEILGDLIKNDCSRDLIDAIEKSTSLIPFFDFEKELKTLNILAY